jgi:hypothetical protein
VRVLCSFAQATALAPDDDDQWTDDEELPPNPKLKARRPFFVSFALDALEPTILPNASVVVA